MGSGFISISLGAAGGVLPVSDADVTITKTISGELVFDQTVQTDPNGNTSPISVPAPDKGLSFDEYPTKVPYETYDVEVVAPSYVSTKITGVQVFDGVHCIVPVNFLPNDNDAYMGPPRDFAVPTHHLDIAGGGNGGGGCGGGNCGCGSCEYDIEESYRSRILRRPIIPTYITVHLGKPDNNRAENLRIPFTEYIKNVCCSEVYPTWPDNALIANIHCQVSLALNRIYTEWYRSRGYSFDIINSTQYDQAFVKGRGIAENVSRLVDRYFNVYVRKGTAGEPYYTEYCDGRQVSCPGLKQWGTLSLAEKGYSPLEILQYYYGNTISLYESSNFTERQDSYPGTPLRLGSVGNDVSIIQTQLNRIRKNFPSIPLINPVDGKFGANTENAVKAFQKAFHLSQDGVVGKATWYKISYIYVSVKKLAELGSEGDVITPEAPKSVLMIGSTGNSVRYVQYMLRVISKFFRLVRPIEIDGIYGLDTDGAVRDFQKYFGLSVDGMVGKITYKKIIEIFGEVYPSIEQGCSAKPYGGWVLRMGSTGQEVLEMQTYLNAIGVLNTSLPKLVEDGKFGAVTEEAVLVFQRTYSLTADGLVGPDTWFALAAAYCALPKKPPCPLYGGTLLRYGSTGQGVRDLQMMLNIISLDYPQIDRVKIDGIFGIATQNSLITFQRLAGLPADGIAGPNTWNQLCIYYNNVTVA